MQEVAHHLQVTALPKAGSAEGDRFGRSAFNRYYYATFLIVREGLSQMASKWAKPKHAAIPDLLRGSVSQAIKSGRVAANRQRDAELVAQCNRAVAAANELAKLLELANGARKVADYNPDVRVEFKGVDRFALNGINVDEAHGWASRARFLVDAIVDTWRQIHV